MSRRSPAVPEIQVDLDLPPDRRWVELRAYAERIAPMLRAYVQDLGDVSSFRHMIAAYIEAQVSDEIRAEFSSLSSMTGLRIQEIALANLYYDAVKLAFGCTAFVYEGSDGPIHARNLDWWSPNRMLTDNTIVMHYLRGGRRHFSVVGWPGFVGALSGVAPGRFAVTLNAVLSDEPTTYGPPISLVLRDVLDRATDYDDAVRRLSSTEVFTDSLLLVSGVSAGQMCVIERTPTRHAIRRPVDGAIVVTNDYRALEDANADETADDLRRTSCGRYDRAVELLGSRVGDEFAILTDPQVIMTITTQHMRFVARSGSMEVRLPDRIF